ncbi:hypothetical protein HA402_000471 [Bradysia odoriphaga]|nr:hypothetical protein HA402_000471 [Bradysia odoriphaga]
MSDFLCFCRHEAMSMQQEPMDTVSSPNNVDVDSGVSVDEMELITFEGSKVDDLVNSMAFENDDYVEHEVEYLEHVEQMDISTADEIEFRTIDECNFIEIDGSMTSYNIDVSANNNNKESDMSVDGMVGSLEEVGETPSVTFPDEFKSQNITKTIEADVIGLNGCSTPRRRTVRYPGDINEHDEMSPRTARPQAKEIYKLRQTVRRQKKQIETLKQLMKNLKTKFSLSSHAVQSMESTFEDDIIQQLKEGRKTESYSENVKSFALTLNFYSNAAYEYIRKTFGKHLPSVSTLSRWYKTVDGEPGMSVEALTILKSMSDDMRKLDKTLYVALMADEMAIRKQLIWNESKKQFIGYVDYGIGIECNDTTEEATDALFFMVVPINSKGKLPLAYYLTNKFTGDEKSELLKNLLRVIDDTGAEVLSLTFDGAGSNIAMVEILGANFDPTNFKPYFENPYTNQRIHIFLDVCHMVKLLRNNWASKGIFYDENGQQIKWEYVEKLERLQSEKGLSLATKLTKQHINFYNNKMKVSLAVQIFSTRVADALTYCKDMEDFKGCDATIKFIKTVNDVFDVLNSNKFNNHARLTKRMLKVVTVYSV